MMSDQGTYDGSGRSSVLEVILKEIGPVAVAFSGGVDSTYLLYECRICDIDVVPVFVKSEFTRRDEPDFAAYLCDEMGLDLNIIDHDCLSDPGIRSNTSDRCYLCKKRMFSAIADAFPGRTVLDGTNASDLESERPGMRALGELGVRSPLREARLAKSDIRMLSRDAEVPTWDMESNSCVATRVSTGVLLDAELLRRVEESEYVMNDLGFIGIRVRTDGVSANVQVKEADLEEASERFGEISEALSPYFGDVVLDSEGRR